MNITSPATPASDPASDARCSSYLDGESFPDAHCFLELTGAFGGAGKPLDFQKLLTAQLLYIAEAPAWPASMSHPRPKAASATVAAGDPGELSDGEIFSRLAQRGLHEIATITDAMANDAGGTACPTESAQHLLDISFVLNRVLTQLLTEESRITQDHSHSAETTRFVRHLQQREAEASALDPARRSTRAEALWLLARLPKLA